MRTNTTAVSGNTKSVKYIDNFFKLGRAHADGGSSDADVKLAYQIINACYIARKKTIISSEWLMDELMDFDEATADRIYEMSKGYSLQIARETGRNYRFLESEQGEKMGNEELNEIKRHSAGFAVFP